MSMHFTNMIDAADAVAFASGITHDGRKIGKEVSPNILAQARLPISGAEHDVHQYEGKRKGHPVDYRPGRWPSMSLHLYSWDVAPCWHQIAPLALVSMLMLSALFGCKSASHSPLSQSATAAPNYSYPTRPTVPPPPFKIFHHDASTFTLVTKDNATDAEVEAILWQLRDAAHSHSLDKLGISEKAIDDHKPTAWFHIYRGAKCAAEKYAPGEPPCGGSYHAAGDYTFGSSANPNWDDGILRNASGQELPLWDVDAPAKP